MRVYHVGNLRESIVRPTAVCLGVFDGVHLGHRRLIDETLKVADEKGLQALVHTYDPLPISVLDPQKALCELTPLKRRLQLLEEAGINFSAVSKFDDTLQHMPGKVFFEEVLLKKLNAKHIVAGFNHRFGFRADTDIMRLGELCQEAGVGLSVIQPVNASGGRLISSSAIREALLRGDIALAQEMLGREVDDEILRQAKSALPPLTNKVLSMEGGPK